MPDLLIRIKKKSDGTSALTCIRPDGTTTWQRQDGRLGAFFPFHDLTHHAVETVLGLRQAFYGLVADGWDLSSFGDPTNKGQRLPDDAMIAELTVGLLDLERATGVIANADEFNDKIQSYFANKELGITTFRLDDDQLARIRSRRDDLFTRWRALSPGAALELPFERGVIIAA